MNIEPHVRMDPSSWCYGKQWILLEWPYKAADISAYADLRVKEHSYIHIDLIQECTESGVQHTTGLPCYAFSLLVIPCRPAMHIMYLYNKYIFIKLIFTKHPGFVKFVKIKSLLL